MDPQAPAVDDDSDSVGATESGPPSDAGPDQDPPPADRPPTWEPL
ncbi:MAG: hypothetical protein ACRDPQ_18305 [Nocardioidaceae bacterium]